MCFPLHVPSRCLCSWSMFHQYCWRESPGPAVITGESRHAGERFGCLQIPRTESSWTTTFPPAARSKNVLPSSPGSGGVSAFLKHKSDPDQRKACEKCVNVYTPFISPSLDGSKIDEWIPETFPESPRWAKIHVGCRKLMG